MIDLIVHIHKYGDIKVNGTNTITISIIEKKKKHRSQKKVDFKICWLARHMNISSDLFEKYQANEIIILIDLVDRKK